MKRQFWLDRWANSRIGFHQVHGHPMPHAHWSALELASSARVLVPLCGKSRDMAWLAAQGHAVTGVELSDVAARAFFTEQGDTPRLACGPTFNSYHHDHIEIHVGDIFDLPSKTIATFDAVYDRAALIALPSAMRQRYARHLADALRPGAISLLITLDYDTTQMEGPPFAVTQAEIHTYFGADCDIRHLAERDGLADADHLRARGLTAAREHLYRIEKR